MPRQVRIQYPGAMYHVMARGDRREAIFRDAADRTMFLEVLAQACARTGWRCHAYVLMSNHYHLVLETPQPNLVAGMAWVQNTYTRRHNVRHRLWGHLFGGRYKAVLVEESDPQYFLTLIDYVHLNPVRAGLVALERGLESFPWSSLSYYLAPVAQRQAWQQAEMALAAAQCEDGAAGRRRYLERLERRAREEGAEAGRALPDGQSLQSTLRRGWCFGSEGFKEKLLSLAQTALRSRRRSADFAAAPEVRDHQLADAEMLVARAMSVMGLDEAILRTVACGERRKALIALAVKESTTVPLAWIAQRLAMGTRSTVSREVGALARRIKTDPALAREYRQLIDG